ncbi:MAG TPA: Clp protease N-terminal domain-containing protein [Streptosporangiaceae bacterium]|nr:Clp protease N-terminal domain-containing protein [Streptosporangiaceae bacterium]
MLERFTGDARGVVTGAREGALRLGHDWIGCEHLLLALTATGGAVGTILRDQGITPDRVRQETVRLAGAGRGASLFDVLDRDALASIGIDLDAVRGKVEAAFGPGAFTAAPARHPRRRHWVHRRVRRARQARWAAAPASGGGTRAAGPARAPVPGEGSGAGPRRVPFTPRAKKCLMHAVREARAEHTGQIGVEHLGLAIVSMTDGAVPPILSALGSSGPRLRAEILGRYRQAS